MSIGIYTTKTGQIKPKEKKQESFNITNLILKLPNKLFSFESTFSLLFFNSNIFFWVNDNVFKSIFIKVEIIVE